MKDIMETLSKNAVILDRDGHRTFSGINVQLDNVYQNLIIGCIVVSLDDCVFSKDDDKIKLLTNGGTIIL